MVKGLLFLWCYCSLYKEMPDYILLVLKLYETNMCFPKDFNFHVKWNFQLDRVCHIMAYWLVIRNAAYSTMKFPGREKKSLKFWYKCHQNLIIFTSVVILTKYFTKNELQNLVKVLNIIPCTSFSANCKLLFYVMVTCVLFSVFCLSYRLA